VHRILTDLGLPIFLVIVSSTDENSYLKLFRTIHAASSIAILMIARVEGEPTIV
jgi:hypothetical protein